MHIKKIVLVLFQTSKRNSFDGSRQQKQKEIKQPKSKMRIFQSICQAIQLLYILMIFVFGCNAYRDYLSDDSDSEHAKENTEQQHDPSGEHFFEIVSYVLNAEN